MRFKCDLCFPDILFAERQAGRDQDRLLQCKVIWQRESTQKSTNAIKIHFTRTVSLNLDTCIGCINDYNEYSEYKRTHSLS